MDGGSYLLEPIVTIGKILSVSEKKCLKKTKQYLQNKFRKVHTVWLLLEHEGLTGSQEFIYAPVPNILVVKDSNSCPITSCSRNIIPGYLHCPDSKVMYKNRRSLLKHIAEVHPGIHVLHLKSTQGNKGIFFYSYTWGCANSCWFLSSGERRMGNTCAE